MAGDLSEKLLTHFVGGVWVAPLSTTLFQVELSGEGPDVGHIVLANRADLDRVVSAARDAVGPLLALSPGQRRRLLGDAPVPGILQSSPNPPTSICAVVTTPGMSVQDVLTPLLQALINGQACILQSYKYNPLDGIACADLLGRTELPLGAFNLIHGDLWRAGRQTGYTDVTIR